MSKLKRWGVGALVAAAVLATTANVAVLAGGGFTDVPPGHPFEDEIAWMDQYEISTGYEDGTFRPGAPVTRQAMAAFMQRLASTFFIVESSKDPGASAVVGASATCPEGYQALSGGQQILGSTKHVVWQAYPDGRDWEVAWITTDGTAADPSSVSVWALCGPEEQM